MPAPFKVAVIGCGGMCLCDFDLLRVQSFSGKFPAAYVTTDRERILRDENVREFLPSTPPVMHFDGLPATFLVLKAFKLLRTGIPETVNL